MVEFLQARQLNILLVLGSMCGIIAFFILVTRNISKSRKCTLVYMEISSMLLLFSDRLTYLYGGDTSAVGYYVVRVSNFMVYLMTLSVMHAFNLYLTDLYRNEGGLPVVPLRLRVVEIFITLGELIVIISQFTGLYYTIDANNIYHRTENYVGSYMIPIIIITLQLTVIVHYYERLNKGIRISLMLFVLVSIVASVAQIFCYGLSLTNITIGVMAVMLYVFALTDMNDTLERANRLEIEYLRKEHDSMRRLFEQTATALVNAIDAKDKYTHGHSSRVAEYAKKIAIFSGKSEKEVDEVYYAALLHDVGKIGIPDYIINKDTELTDEEYEVVKTHTIIGEQILSSISEFPYLSLGAKFHHEHYDGKGYPCNLKGDDIPEIARIVAVADAYDVMTSKRKYRDPIPQQTVREEFVKGFETQFDPEFAKIMLHLIDIDSEYTMKEKAEIKELAGKSELVCDEYRSEVSEGIRITSNITRIHLKSRPNINGEGDISLPSIIAFDSLDGRVYSNEKKVKEWNYYEFGEIRFDGRTLNSGVREIHEDTLHYETEPIPGDTVGDWIEYDIEAVKYKDHAQFRISNKYQTTTVIMALPDKARFLYIALTGEHCIIKEVSIRKAQEAVDEDYIPRLADEISYIDVPEGDVPNLQLDGYRTHTTKGFEVKEFVQLKFHAMSLPTAYLVWHCPFIELYYSDDLSPVGPGFKQYALIRLDGEHWNSSKEADNKMVVNKTDEFETWDIWKSRNKDGFDCTITIKRNGKVITTTTENLGVAVKNVTTLRDENQPVYVSLSGDQCALTNIHVTCG